MIPFSKPSPLMRSKRHLLSLKNLIFSGKVSSAVGWAIQQRRVLLDNRRAVKELEEELRRLFQDTLGQNWVVIYAAAHYSSTEEKADPIISQLQKDTTHTGRVIIKQQEQCHYPKAQPQIQHSWDHSQTQPCKYQPSPSSSTTCTYSHQQVIFQVDVLVRQHFSLQEVLLW